LRRLDRLGFLDKRFHTGWFLPMAAKRMLDADVLEKRMRTLLLVLFLGAFPDMNTARARGEQTRPVGEITCALVPDKALGVSY